MKRLALVKFKETSVKNLKMAITDIKLVPHVESVTLLGATAKVVREKKRRCPNCKSTRVINFDADNDLCQKCGNIFPGT